MLYKIADSQNFWRKKTRNFCVTLRLRKFKTAWRESQKCAVSRSVRLHKLQIFPLLWQSLGELSQISLGDLVSRTSWEICHGFCQFSLDILAQKSQRLPPWFLAVPFRISSPRNPVVNTMHHFPLYDEWPNLVRSREIRVNILFPTVDCRWLANSIMVSFVRRCLPPTTTTINCTHVLLHKFPGLCNWRLSSPRRYISLTVLYTDIFGLWSLSTLLYACTTADIINSHV